MSLTFPTSHWTRVFDRAQEGRPLRLKKKKKNSSRSEYQSERSSGDRKRKRKPRSGRTERQTASKLSLLPDLISRAAGMAQSAVKI